MNDLFESTRLFDDNDRSFVDEFNGSNFTGMYAESAEATKAGEAIKKMWMPRLKKNLIEIRQNENCNRKENPENSNGIEQNGAHSLQTSNMTRAWSKNSYFYN